MPMIPVVAVSSDDNPWDIVIEGVHKKNTGLFATISEGISKGISKTISRSTPDEASSAVPREIASEAYNESRGERWRLRWRSALFPHIRGSFYFYRDTTDATIDIEGYTCSFSVLWREDRRRSVWQREEPEERSEFVTPSSVLCLSERLPDNLSD
ncbi:MAG: hypothetical protein AAF662_13855 [Pseudomonadota bacterium]